jgi:hypothetical protein
MGILEIQVDVQTSDVMAAARGAGRDPRVVFSG